MQLDFIKKRKHTNQQPRKINTVKALKSRYIHTKDAPIAKNSC